MNYQLYHIRDDGTLTSILGSFHTIEKAQDGLDEYWDSAIKTCVVLSTLRKQNPSRYDLMRPKAQKTPSDE